MTELEEEAMGALGGVTMRMASSGKRFFRDMESALRANPEFQMTISQAKYLWSLVHLYRNQITGAKIREIAEKVHFGEEPEGIFDYAVHRTIVPQQESQRSRIVRAPKKTRYDEELEKGGGKLKL